MLINMECSDCKKLIASVHLDKIIEEKKIIIPTCPNCNPEKHEDYVLPSHLRGLRFA